MKKIWVAVIAVACAGVFFYVGMVYGKSLTGSSAGAGGRNFAFGSSTTRAFGRGGANGGGGAMGQIISVNGNSMTLQLANGNSQVVFYATSTPVIEPTSVPAAALKNGMQVVVTGSENSDGSLTAQGIQIRPPGFFGGAGNGGVPVGGSQINQQ
ncbi:MAG TPA: DUF5666 domain-containing protein [Candidatus Paceibacterota bacterium]|nr:DUF5666 domain-containing protein [Candidatus Paceibacterota bacterium]